MKNLALFLLLILGSAVTAEPVLLVLEARHEKFTEYYPSNQCESEENCIPWSFWNIYSAKVKHVLAGNFEDETITFAYIQHSQFAPEYLGNIYVVIDRFENQQRIADLGTPYYALSVGIPRSQVCLHLNLEEQFSGVDMPFSDEYNCYYETDLMEIGTY